jgi:hypothetical protein
VRGHARDRGVARTGLALLLAVGLLSLGACSGSRYETSQVRVALNFIAKETCSCLFVAERPEEECRKYVEIRQLSPKVLIDRGAKTVTARAFLLLHSVARFSPDTGCSIPR